MEGVMKQWKEVEAEVEEEVGLIQRQAHMHIKTTATENVEAQATEQKNGSSELTNGLNRGLEFSQTEANSGDIEKNTTLHPSDTVISGDSASLNNVTTESERVGIITENMQLVKELYLESLYRKPSTQGFYCPHCRTCIQKVLLLDTVREVALPAQPPPSPERFRCPECFSFLIPIGSWFFHGLVRENDVSTIEGVQHPPDHSRERPSDGRTEATPGTTVQAPGQVNTAADSGKQMLQPEQVSDGADKASNEEDDHKTRDSSKHFSEIPQDDHGQDGSKKKHSRWGLIASASAVAIVKKRSIDISEESEQPPRLEEVIVDDGNTELSARTTLAAATRTGVVQESGSSKTLEILKSIVYGGLIEAIASLSVVTSSASSDATTLNILVLSLANLIGGLFILVHHIWDLKSEQPRTNNETNTSVDRYYEVLGKRENFFLHACIAILSFIIFGLVPPLVYAFTFNESNNKDLKLAAVAGASALCITLLSIAKAYIQRQNTYLTYLQTVLYYLSSGAVASIVSYLAGELIKELLEKLGWFDSGSSSFTLLLPEMSIEKPRFGSF